MIVLDTTVLVYAVGDEHPLREPCRRVLSAHGSGLIDAVTTLGVISEFAHVRARRRARSDAVMLARSYRAALTMMTTTDEDLDRGLDLFENHPRLGMFDAVLAAFAISRNADALISADRGFDDVEGLRWIDPSMSGLDSILEPPRPSG